VIPAILILFFLCRSLPIGGSYIFVGELPMEQEKVPEPGAQRVLKLRLQGEEMLPALLFVKVLF
jgi:hypothetical protein